MKDSTLCYIFDGSRMLLQKKARGFGKGKWNAPGGKIKIMESPDKAAIREVQEETGLRVNDLEYVGILNFIENRGKVFSVHVFQTSKFSGDIRASDEGKLKWFEKDSLPLDDMWEDDAHWLPYLIKGEKFRGDFLFDKGFKSLLEHKMVRV